MTILLTGASGFLGGYFFRELSADHEVVTLGRRAVGSAHIHCDLSWQTPVLPGIGYDLVVHAAGKAHSVPRTDSERADYDRVNVQGTERLLKALGGQPRLPQALVYISTVLVYGRSTGELLDEDTPLAARDAYGPSKVRAEELVRNWARRTGVRLTVLRLPLVAGIPLTGNLASMQQAIQRGYYARIGQAEARRSMVRADDVAAVLVRASAEGGIYHLTDGYHPTVHELEEALARQAGRSRVPVIPARLARRVARLGDSINAVVGRRFPLDTPALTRLTSTLTFSDAAARHQFQWAPRPVLDLFR